METGEPPRHGGRGGGETWCRVPGPPRSGGPGYGARAVTSRSSANQLRQPSRRRQRHRSRGGLASNDPSLPPFPVRYLSPDVSAVSVGSLGQISHPFGRQLKRLPCGAPIPPKGNKSLEEQTLRLIVLTVVAAAVAGMLAGGTFRDFPSVKIRGAWLALAGVVLQFIPVGGAAATVLALCLVRRPDRLRGPQHPGARLRVDHGRPGAERRRHRGEQRHAGDPERSRALEPIRDARRPRRERGSEASPGG